MYHFTKTIALCITAAFFCTTIFAQAPQGISYQAIARNSGGALIPNQNISLRFSIHDATANGAIVYSETQSATTNALGLFSLFVGKGTPVTGTFTATDWAGAPKFLQVEMDVTGGTAYTDMGTQQVMSVPYSIYAEKAGNGFDRMTQSQIDALIPVEGMVVFNTDAHKMQVYAMLTNNADILNEIYTGTSSSFSPGIQQNFTPPISGQVIAVDVLVKDNGPAFPSLDFSANSISGSTVQTINIPNPLTDFTWVTVLLINRLVK